MKITKGSGSVRDSLVGLIVPGLLTTTLVGVIAVKWRPALATEPAPLPPGTLSALHRAAVKEIAAERAGHEAFRCVASKGRVGDPGGLPAARDDLSRAVAAEQNFAGAPAICEDLFDGHPEFDRVAGPAARALAKASSTK